MEQGKKDALAFLKKTTVNAIKNAKAELICGALLLCAMAAVYPLGLAGTATYASEGVSEPYFISEPLAGDEASMDTDKETGLPVLHGTQAIEGIFLGNGKTLASLGFKISLSAEAAADVARADASGEYPEDVGALLLSVQDGNGDIFYEGALSLYELKNNEYCKFPIEKETLDNEYYLYTLTTTDCDADAVSVWLVYPDSVTLEYQYAGYTEVPGIWLYPLMRFSYREPLTFMKALPVWLGLLTLYVVFLAARGFFKKRGAWTAAVLLAAFYASSFVLLSDESHLPITLTGRELENVRGTHEYDYVGISDNAELAGVMAKTREFALDRGTYKLGVGYHTNTAYCTVTVYDNGRAVANYALDPEVAYKTYEITLESDTPFLYATFNYAGQGYLIVNNFSLTAENGFDNDAVYYAVLLWVAALAAVVAGSAYARRSKRRIPATAGLSAAFADEKGTVGTRLPAYAALLFLGIFCCYPYFQGYLPWGDDLCYHLVRIEGIKDALRAGQFPVVLYPEGLNGFGYLNCMYPSLFLYLPALLRLCGVSISASYKSLIFLFQLATPFTTYYAVRRICEAAGQSPYRRKGRDGGLRAGDGAGLLAAFLYCLCPYRFTNFYARGALGEALAMTFFPLLFAGIYLVLYAPAEGVSAGGVPTEGTSAAGAQAVKVMPAHSEVCGKGIRGWVLLAVGMTGLLQTHILSCLFGLLLCAFFFLLRLPRVFRERRDMPLTLAAISTCLANLWFIFPFLYFYLHGNLSKEALNWSSFSEYALLPFSLVGGMNTKDFRTLALGLPLLLCAAITGVYLLTEQMKIKEIGEKEESKAQEEKNKELVSKAYAEDSAIRDFLSGALVAGSICVCAATYLFPAGALMEGNGALRFLLRTIQFPWRLLGPASALLAMSGAIALTRKKPPVLSPALAPALAPMLAVGLSLLSIFAVAHYDASGGEYYAYKSFDDAYTQGHYLKRIGVPKSENTIVYPYEWRTRGASDEVIDAPSALPRFSAGASQRTGEACDAVYRRIGTTSVLDYHIEKDTDIDYVELPLLYYPVYTATDENGNVLPLSRGNDALLRAPLSREAGSHRIIVSYRAPFASVLGGVASGLFFLCVLGCGLWRLHKRKQLV